MTKVLNVEPHPNPEVTKLELLDLGLPGPNEYFRIARVVTGKHYRVGQLGIWIRPGAVIPGWLAHELWLVGKKRAEHPFVVREIEIKGVPSPGLFCGEVYMNDGSAASAERFGEYGTKADPHDDRWVLWKFWDPEWKAGDFVGDELGITSEASEASAEA